MRIMVWTPFDELVDFNFLLHFGRFKLTLPSIPVTGASEGELGKEQLIIQRLTFVPYFLSKYCSSYEEEQE